MSIDNRKDGDTSHRRPEEEDFDFDIGNDLPPPKPDFQSFEMEDLPSPSAPPPADPPRARPAAAAAAEDAFEDFADEAEVQPPPVGSRAARPEPEAADDESDYSFEDGEDEVDEQPARAPARAARMASFEDDHDEGTSANARADLDEEGEAEDGDGDDADADADEGEAKKKFTPQQAGVYAIGAAVALFAGYMVWSATISPLLFSPSQTPAPAPTIAAGAPPKPSGQASLPTLTQQPGSPALPQNPGSGPQLPQIQQAQQQPVKPVPPAPNVPSPSVPSVQQPAPQAAVQPDPRVTELAAKVAELAAKVSAAPAPQRPDLENRLTALEQRLAALETVRPTTPKPAVEPPAKPAILSQYQLAGVARDVAWVKSGTKGTIEVKAGTELPGAGTVKAITRYDKDWVVVTTAGVIVR